MRVRITTKRAKPDEGLKTYIRKKVIRFSKIASNILDTQVILEEDASLKVAEITVNMRHLHFAARQGAGDFYQSVDGAARRLTQQIKKHTDAVRQRRNNMIIARIKRIFRERF